MGSLMSGWNSPRHRSGKAWGRTSSFTKEEIDQFWKDKQATDEANVPQATELTSSQDPATAVAAAEVKKWNSFQGVNKTKHEIAVTEAKDWWKKTNYAFLNDRPDEVGRGAEGKNYKAFHGDAYKRSKSMPAPSPPLLSPSFRIK